MRWPALAAALASADERTAALAPLNLALHEAGLVRGWRNEQYGIVTQLGQDGEVAELALKPVAEALALAASDAMTVDASLVTLEFALRHQLVASSHHDRLAGLLMPLLARN